MPSVRLRSHRALRDPARLPLDDDDALGAALFARLAGALVRGRPRPVLLTLWDEEVAQYDLPGVFALPPPDRGPLIAAMAGQPEARAAAMVGVLELNFARMPRPMAAATVFLEWPDNRWWTAWQILDTAGRPVGEGPVIRRAVDGSPRPGGMGGWFSTCRRLGLKLNLEPVDPIVYH